MSKLLDKVRAITPKERRELAKDKIFLLNIQGSGREEEIMYRVLDMVLTPKEVESVESFDEESELFSKIINITYGLEEEDSKN